MGKKETGAPAKPVKPQTVETKPLEKITHANIFAALAALHAENPTIERTKEFGKEGDNLHWWYSPLDEVLKTVRPLTARHGLAFTFEQGNQADDMVCALYHETYVKQGIANKVGETKAADGTIETAYNIGEVTESNVLRSMPIKVKRDGDMKKIGADSTYARRYTLAEVIGIAPDEDTDAKEFEKARGEQAGKAMFTRVQNGIKTAKTGKELDASAKVLKQNMSDLEAGKIPQLGLTEGELVELGILVEERMKELGIGVTTAPVGHGAHGENKDSGGEAEVQVGDEEAPANGSAPSTVPLIP